MNWKYTLEELKSKAQPKSTGYCARFVANALLAGGFTFQRQPYAHLYSKILPALGFQVVSPNKFQAGDVAVFTPFPGQVPQAGHIQMYDGLRWISDFVQKRFIPGASFERSTCILYRHPDFRL